MRANTSNKLKLPGSDFSLPEWELSVYDKFSNQPSLNAHDSERFGHHNTQKRESNEMSGLCTHGSGAVICTEVSSQSFVSSGTFHPSSRARHRLEVPFMTSSLGPLGYLRLLISCVPPRVPKFVSCETVVLADAELHVSLLKAERDTLNGQSHFLCSSTSTASWQSIRFSLICSAAPN